MSTENTTETPAPAPAPAPVIETPKAIVSALGKLNKASESARLSYVNLAKVTRDFGKKTTLKPVEQKVAIAKALAEANGVEIEVVTTSPKKFEAANPEADEALLKKNRGLYVLLSTLCGIASPKDEERAALLDEELENSEADWHSICAASRAKKVGEGRPDKEPKEEKVEVFNESRLSNAIVMLVTKAQVAGMSAQITWDIAAQALKGAITESAFADKADCKFVI